VADLVGTYIVRVTLVTLSARKVSNVPDSPNNTAAVFESLGLPCDLAAPAVVDAENGVSSLQSAYLSSVTDSESSKVRRYLRMRDDVAPETYDTAPYLRTVAVVMHDMRPRR